MPLMEIVTEPDARSPEEAVAYLTKLRQILRYIGVSDADMEEGNFRCEPNLSLRPRGADEFGSKVELKNLNSFRAALRGMEFEVERQSRLLNDGKHVPSETRGCNTDLSSYQSAHHYRPSGDELHIHIQAVFLKDSHLSRNPHGRKDRSYRRVT